MQEVAPPASLRCYKCGQTGHWSRSCTLPEDQWLNRSAPAPPPVQATPQRAQPGLIPRAPASRPTPGHARTPLTTGLTASARSCFKCGKPGHWATACTAPREEWVQQGAETPVADAAAAFTLAPDTTPIALERSEKELRKELRKRGKKRKITFEDLKDTGALQDLYHTLPGKFRAVCKGKGHEGGDLRRLLQLYEAWARKWFPQHTFDEAIREIEALSTSMRMKSELREMRRGLIEDAIRPYRESLEPPRAEAGSPAREAEGQGEAAAAPSGEAGQGPEGSPKAPGAGDAAAEDEDMEGDELMDLMQTGEVVWQPAGPGASVPGGVAAPPGDAAGEPSGAAAQQEGESDSEDERILELVRQQQMGLAQAPTGEADPPGPAPVPEQGLPQEGAAGEGPEAEEGSASSGDEELLELVRRQQMEGWPGPSGATRPAQREEGQPGAPPAAGRAPEAAAGDGAQQE